MGSSTADLPPDSKTALRTRLRERRRELYGGPEGERRRREESQQLLHHASGLIAEVARAAAGAEAPVQVAAFHPTPTEPDVMPLVAALREVGAEVLFPAAAGRELEWIVWDGSSAFEASAGRGFGREPQGRRLGSDALRGTVLVLAPALALDRSGTRIGHGAGYYDRALLHVPDAARVVAVVHPHELLEPGALPRESHDVPVPAVLTAAGLVTPLGPAPR